MSMITRCPGCGTSFRVTLVQLEARAGQARCGRCGVVFDARVALVSDSVPTTPERDFAAALEAEIHRAGETPRTGLAVPSAPEADFALQRGTIGAVQAAPLDFGPRSRTPPSRLWWLGSTLLLLLLVAQAAYRYRGDLALLVPEAKPTIQKVCVELNCDVPLPRRTELMSIESSDLRADGANPSVMVLSATLRNRAAFAQALPALELTLTDAQNQTVARRVLMPQDYAPRGTRLDSGFAASSELPAKVFIEVGTLKATGYRLYLFYS
ncbi:MAG: DUF3426 domain-containing protein [Burkholderiales bacterium]